MKKLLERISICILFIIVLAFHSYANGFEIHYIDVGQADASLIMCDGEYMLIDGGDPSSSSLIYTYLKNHNINHLKYIVGTHADEDHIGGLPGALNYASIDNALCSTKEHDTRSFNSFVKYLNQQGKSISIPNAGDRFTLGSAQAQIIGPINITADSNNSSIVIRIMYGNTAFLFTGDAGFIEENDILNSGYELRSDVIKVGHHGSNSATGEAFLKAVDPKFAVISVGKNNSYGHPTNEVLFRLNTNGVVTYRTDYLGDIICRSDGNNISFLFEKEKSPQLLSINENANEERIFIDRQNNEKLESEYVLNTNTKKFHYSDCSSVYKMKEKNKRFFNGTRDEAINSGYSPCGNCKP